jgi:copper chaperone
METITLKVEGMSCGHCVQSVKQALESVEGVSLAQVDLARGEAIVSLDPDKAGTAHLASAVDQAGYKVVET